MGASVQGQPIFSILESRLRSARIPVLLGEKLGIQFPLEISQILGVSKLVKSLQNTVFFCKGLQYTWPNCISES